MNKPKVNNWATAYFILNLLPILLMCFWAIADGWFPSDKVLLKHPLSDDNFYLFNKSLAAFTGTFCILATIPIWILALCKRKPWVWITTLVFIAIGITNNPFMGIPILIFWIKDNNKKYYGK